MEDGGNGFAERPRELAGGLLKMEAGAIQLAGEPKHYEAAVRTLAVEKTWEPAAFFVQTFSWKCVRQGVCL